MNQQIKSKELPVDWLVTDTYYPSGNKDFVKESEFKCPDCGDVSTFSAPSVLFDQCENHCADKEATPLGTRHIQLRGANSNKSALWGWFKSPIKSWATGKNTGAYWNAHMDENLKASILRRQGKDFFIYKVTEEK